jgi:hypothetical protein
MSNQFLRPGLQVSTQDSNWVKELGFTTLYEPGGNPPTVDIVFVHGLQGHPWRTWRYKGKLKRRTTAKGNQPWTSTESGRIYWPADLLPNDEPEVRILTYGYDSRVTKWFRGATNQIDIQEHGVSLLNALDAERRDCRRRPLLFVVHSLGGLVVKQAIQKSRNEKHHPHLHDIYLSLHGIIFFGTPHRGSPDDGWGILLRNIANAAFFDTNDSILRELNPTTGADMLDLLTQDLREVANEKDVQITSFQESRGKLGISLLRSKVGYLQYHVYIKH